MKSDFVKNLALGFGVTLVFFVLIELILMIAGVKTLYERTDPAVGFAGYAPLFVKQTQPDREQIYSTALNKLNFTYLLAHLAQSAKVSYWIFMCLSPFVRLFIPSFIA